MKLIKNLIIFIKLIREMEEMAKVYSTLIIMGYKTFMDVPVTLREQVRELLIQLEAEHLIIEE